MTTISSKKLTRLISLSLLGVSFIAVPFTQTAFTNNLGTISADASSLYSINEHKGAHSTSTRKVYYSKGSTCRIKITGKKKATFTAKVFRNGKVYKILHANSKGVLSTSFKIPSKAGKYRPFRVFSFK
ncbi:hypothetical protein [Lactiplantibacillus plantarum]|uniref:hypothetical protein n=1 Tax=Lactiplantibacillus plantarum TaxID=1590 RepID=UPI0020438021|nr:hypothetical protein [Lactiplantibacillus plantarum]MCM2629756.1 hypothetical protein [Lactiplantibacillus plantarum]MCS6155730.1 hypothetical protein [Lactiplantibacillus plantarum]